jgi:hypothetical protein
MKNGRYWAHSRIAWRVVLFAPRLPDGIHCAFSSGQEDVRVGSYGVSQIVTNCEEPILFKIEYLRSDEVDEFVRDETEEATMPAALILSDFMAMIGNCSSVTPSRDASDGRAPRTWESFCQLLRPFPQWNDLRRMSFARILRVLPGKASAGFAESNLERSCRSPFRYLHAHPSAGGTRGFPSRRFVVLWLVLPSLIRRSRGDDLPRRNMVMHTSCSDCLGIRALLGTQPGWRENSSSHLNLFRPATLTW